MSTQVKYTAEQNAMKLRGEREYPKQMWYFFLGCLGVATLNNIISVTWAWHRRRNKRRGGNTVYPQRNGQINPKLLPHALVGGTRIFAYRWRLPALSMTMMEALLTVGFTVATMVWCFINTYGLELRYYANRSGIIAAAHIPLIVALTSKNNLLQFMTGISYEKMNLMHRVTSRVSLIMVWVHLWARWVLNHNIFARAWITAGTVGCVAYTMLVFGSFGAIRRRFYETFWWSHFVLVAVYIFTTWVHLKGARNDYTYYVWPAFIIWGIDRLFRYIRYLVINFLKPKDIPGELELLDADSLRLTVKRTIPLGWQAGQHVFLSWPTLNPAQSHPFTISTVCNGKDSEMMFIIRVREGLTATLKKRVLEKGATTVPTLVEGPYGAPPDITPFTTCIFVAGGSGVCYTYPRFEEIIRQAAAGKACAQRVVFIWSIRSRSHLGWISQWLTGVLSNLPSDLSVVINIHLTKKEMLPMQTLEKEYDEAPHLHEKGRTLSVDNELSPKTSRDPEKNLPTALSSKSPSISDSDNFRGLEAMGVNILQGRPDLCKILEDEVANSDGPVSVDVSGPTPLVSDIRKALSKPFAGPMATLRGAPIIQLNTEDFTM